MIESLLPVLGKPLSESSVTGVIRERLELVKDRAERLEKEVEELREDNRKLLKETRDQQKELTGYREADQYVVSRGILLKRDGKGGYVDMAFCPACRTPLSSLPRDTALKCSKCGFTSGQHYHFHLDSFIEDIKE